MKISIDIGIKNFCILKMDELIINDIKIFNINKDQLIDDVMNIINNFVLIHDNIDYIIIEKQLKNATNNIIIQYIIETILKLNNIKYILLNPKEKYKVIKKEYNVKNINKKKLFNYIDESILIELLKKANSHNKIRKYDDIIDVWLMYKHHNIN